MSCAVRAPFELRKKERFSPIIAKRFVLVSMSACSHSAAIFSSIGWSSPPS